MVKVPYSNAISSIMFLMVCTRPDIAYAINCLSRYMSNAGSPHWEALKWLLRYLNGLKNLGIVFLQNPLKVPSEDLAMMIASIRYWASWVPAYLWPCDLSSGSRLPESNTVVSLAAKCNLKMVMGPHMA
ncbi:Retrovirus-related Pol polyprotein from transposon TNT 1-94 [Sesamum angolense]|uniref:Retrovirus-related Pol polyprotein from transposon TNT 1-94 n=1 Tax=Sesamum angolense TaxID=2727404 RepID=A0AAE1T533_9LAMI|nr:Retrovirus-related Pol polyprotein from transposon TNT 1-94 [Sesamum angolense]